MADKVSLHDLKIWGPAGAGDPAPAPADPVRYTSMLYSLIQAWVIADLLVIPWEEVNAAATAAAAATTPSGSAPSKPESPPPTFHAATTAGVGLMDRRQVMNDTSAGMSLPRTWEFRMGLTK